MEFPFQDRRQAGQKLAEKLSAYAHRPDVVVLALPRGGVPVAYEVARALDVPLDLFLVRKLGVPGYEELAMGAVASGGVRVQNNEVVHGLGIPEYVIDSVAAREQQEVARRERIYRGGRPPPDVKDRTVILVDDGLATGSTMLAAIRALRRRQPARIVVAVPTAAAETCEQLRKEADEVICAITPEPFLAVGRWYEEFAQTTDEEVRELLAQRREPAREPAAHGGADTLAKRARAAAHRLTGAVQDYNPLIERVGDAHIVLLGEASHGTHEFYRERALITRRLVEEKRFAAVAVEADWPDAYRVNRFVNGNSDDVDATEALADFRRFPTWMWRNTDVVEFVDWMREHNDALPPDRQRLGFYGLDLYSLHASMKAVLSYLENVDPEGAKRARERFACFDHFGEDVERYGFLTGTGLAAPCEKEVVSQLVDLERKAMDYTRRGVATEEQHFFAQMNARVVKNAEAYYRSMFLERVSSWNLRDRHMMETLEAILGHLRTQVTPAKIVVWAHNSHLGDARATQMGGHGELNLGQLVREKWGADAVLVGFTTHHGTVTAASDWGSPAERKNVRPALAGSWEALLHETGLGRFLLAFGPGAELTQNFRNPQRLERAIGVIYRPETERASHYFSAGLSDQFDAVVHFDETRAVEPLERTADWDAGDVPETFPFAV